MAIKRKHGLSFLLVFGFLFLVSGGLFVIQVWGEPGKDGSAAALEAPTAPPSLSPPGGDPVPPPEPAKKIGGSDSPKSDNTEASEPATSDEKKSPDSSEEAAPEEEKPEEPKKEEKKPALKSVPAPVVKVVAPPLVLSVPQEKPVPSKIEKVEEKKDSKVEKKKEPSKAVSESPKPESPREAVPSLRPLKKSVRKAKKVVQQDPGVIPPEWNWFAEPMKLEYAQGGIRIASLQKVDSASDIAHLPQGAKTSKTENSVALNISKPDFKPQEPTLGAHRDVLFARVLERVQKRKDTALNSPRRRETATPIRSVGEKRVSKSLTRLKDVLEGIINRLPEQKDSSSIELQTPFETPQVFVPAPEKDGEALYLPHPNDDSRKTIQSSFSQEFELKSQGLIKIMPDTEAVEDSGSR